MKEPLPHCVLPRAGCAPWARANIPDLAENIGRWEIDRNHPLDWEKTQKEKGLQAVVKTCNPFKIHWWS